MLAELERCHVNYELSGPRIANESGSGGELGTICLLHCFGSDHHFWDMQMPWLSGYRVLRPDARGHGFSARPAGPYTLQDMAGDVVGLLDHLHIDRVHLAGASMGGMVAQTLALNHPDRFVSLQLITTTHEYTDAQRRAWLGLINEVQSGDAGNVGTVSNRLMARWFCPDSIASDCLGYQYMSEVFSRFHPDSFCWAGEAVRTVDLGSQLHQIQLPTRIIASAHDPGVPEPVSRHLANRISNAQLLWTPYAHHLASLEHPAMVGWMMRGMLDQLSTNGPTG